MASIIKRGDYQWRAVVRRRGYPPQSKTFITKADAEAWAREIETEIDRGVFVSRVEAERTTLREALERYDREIVPQKRGAIADGYRVRQLARDRRIADRFLASLRGADIAAWRDARLAEGVKPATVNRDLGTLSHVFSVAIRDWGMESLRNPVSLVRRPQARNGRDRRLEPGEEAELLRRAEIYGQPLPAVITFAIETGMRRGEIASLRWEHVDLERRVAHLPLTKNGDSRDVPLSSRAQQVLCKQYDRHKLEFCGGQPGVLPLKAQKPTGLVFGMRPDSISQAFARITGRAAPVKNAKGRMVAPVIENLTFHDLRHEATSRFFERGLSVVEVQAITGHKTLAMLARYTHLQVGHLVEKLG